MITDLEKALSIGSQWPPESEAPRIKLYEENTNLYKGRHEQVYTILKNLYATAEAESNKLLVIVNWPKRLSLLWADLLLGQPPKLRSGELKSLNQLYLNSITEDKPLWAEAYKVAIDVSRFGTGIFKVFAEEGQPAQIQAVSPKKWFPIADSTGQVIAHLIAWKSPDNKILNVELHQAGSVQSGWYAIIEDKIASVVQDLGEIPTGYDEPLIFPVHNVQTSEDTEGTDDYQDIDKLLKRIETTFTRSGRILDAHSEPAFAVPGDALTPNPATGERTYNPKTRVFPIEEGEPLPQYITWDGQLTAAFVLVDKIMDQFYAISETCRTAFEPDKIGNQISGTALRMLMMAPLKKVKRLKTEFDPQLKAAIKAISYLEVQHKIKDAVPLDSISSEWKDGLPQDFTEKVKNYTSLKAQGLVTNERATAALFDLEGKELDDEVKKLKEQAPEMGAY
jgi:hypothetical protein